MEQDTQRAGASARADRSRQVAKAATELAANRGAWARKNLAAQKRLAATAPVIRRGTISVRLTDATLTARRRAADASRAAAAREVARARADRLAIAERAAARIAAGYALPLTTGVRRNTFGMSGPLWSNRHTGQDFPAAMGTPVRSAGAGTVTAASWAGAYGQRVKILLDDGTEIWYCHLSSYVVTGGRVNVGQVVARVGSTGNSTGPHLHMEVHLRKSQTASDPLAWLRSKGLNI